MSRCTLFVFLLAFVSWGMMAVLPGKVLAHGPMLARDYSRDAEPFVDGQADERALTVLYNTCQLEQALQNRALSGRDAITGRIDAGEPHAQLEAPGTGGPMLAQDDSRDPLSRIDARGAGGGPMLVTDADADGPMLAQLDLDDADGPMLAEGPAIGPRRDSREVGDAPEEPIEIPADQEALYREIREMRQMLDRLREEAAARDRLRISDDEERDQEKEILEAAGRQYSLIPPWLFRMDLRAHYSYNDYDVIRALGGQQGTRIEHVSNHQITNNFSLETGVRDNLSIDATVPFVYKYDKVSTAESRDTTNLGDISLGLKYQPIKTGRGYPSPILSFSYTFPTGKSPYEINPATELSTGSGFHAMQGGVSVSQPFDPVNAFGSLSYNYRFRETGIGQGRSRGVLDEVDPGGGISASMGFGYAVSYRMSMSLSLSTSYAFSTDYYWRAREGRQKTKSGDSVSASLGLSTSWRVTPRRTIIIGIGQGLTTANPGFSMSVRMPVSLDMR